MITVQELEKLPYPDKIYAIGLKIVGPFTASHKHHLLECGSCGNQWTATPLAKVSAYKKYLNPGCPVCTHNKRYGETQNQARTFIEERGFEILSTGPIKQTTMEKIIVRNKKCGHTFESAPGNLIHNNVECPICAREYINGLNKDRGNARHEEYVEIASEWDAYDTSCRILTRQTYNAFENEINPNGYFIGGAGVAGAFQVDHIISVRVGFDKKIPKELIAHKDNLQVIPWETNSKHKMNFKFVPKIFAEWFDCSLTNVFEEMLFNMGFERDTFAPFPLCFKRNDISVTFCVFEHFQEKTTFRRQISKKVKEYYHDIGFRNIQIFEDEFVNHPLLIERKILHILKLNTDVEILHARKCEIELLSDMGQKSRFLNNHHIQGNDSAQISYGAFHNKKLIAVMTFNKPRVFYNKSKPSEGVWELSRFAVDTSVRVTGVAQRLLKQFCEHNEWSDVFSYADRRWSEGEMYYKMGFDRDKVNPPGYFYIVDGKRKHRWNYRKDVLKTWDNYLPHKTEFAITSEKGIARIWDCGTIRFNISNPNFIKRKNTSQSHQLTDSILTVED